MDLLLFLLLLATETPTTTMLQRYQLFLLLLLLLLLLPWQAPVVIVSMPDTTTCLALVLVFHPLLFPLPLHMASHPPKALLHPLPAFPTVVGPGPEAIFPLQARDLALILVSAATFRILQSTLTTDTSKTTPILLSHRFPHRPLTGNRARARSPPLACPTTIRIMLLLHLFRLR